MTAREDSLAHRLGKTVHVSPLLIRLGRLRRTCPWPAAQCLEDWLLAVANARGARVVIPAVGRPEGFAAPSAADLSNEELVVAICHPCGRDRPQALRAAAQLVSRGAVAPPALLRVARRERAEPILAELARQALKVEPEHPAWAAIARALEEQKPLRQPILHWTRLAEPILKDGRCNAASWRLVA